MTVEQVAEALSLFVEEVRPAIVMRTGDIAIFAP